MSDQLTRKMNQITPKPNSLELIYIPYGRAELQILWNQGYIQHTK